VPTTPPLTEQVLDALQRAGCPVTTTDLTRLLNEGRATPLIIDRVYGAAAALRARGAVRRLRSPANKRVRYWAIAAAAEPVCSCSQPQSNP
jgi:hypothetical protein